MENLIDLIQKYSLTVRCLPYIVEENWSYVEGQKLIKGEILTYWKPTIEYFINSTSKYNRADSAEKRMKVFYEKFPEGIPRAHSERKVEKGGWWYVKETPNTSSTVRFSREHDKFFAPTIKEAMKLFLDSKK